MSCTLGCHQRIRTDAAAPRNNCCIIGGRSEGFPHTGLFHPWARWGGGLVAGKSSVSSSRDRARPYHVAIKCKSRHEPIGARGFLRVWGRFFRILGRRERTKELKTHVRCSLFPHIAIIFRNAPNIKCYLYPSLIPGPYLESLTRNKCHLMEALYGVVPYKASITGLSIPHKAGPIFGWKVLPSKYRARLVRNM